MKNWLKFWFNFFIVQNVVYIHRLKFKNTYIITEFTTFAPILNSTYNYYYDSNSTVIYNDTNNDYGNLTATTETYIYENSTGYYYNATYNFNFTFDRFLFVFL